MPDLRSEKYAFVAGNILEGHPFPDAIFDFVHQRLLFFAIPGDRWQSVIDELCRVTRPGGWVEVVEGHYGYDPMGPAAQRIADAMLPAMQKRGIDPRDSARLDHFLRTAGLQQVQVQMAKFPVTDERSHHPRTCSVYTLVAQSIGVTGARRRGMSDDIGQSEQAVDSGDTWGGPISAERQAELQRYFFRWRAENDHGERMGPFDHIVLTGADVHWLVESSERDENGRAADLNLNRADLRGAHLEGADLRGVHLEGLTSASHTKFCWILVMC
jgi:SAM-dependent methyltransferase